MLLCACAFNVCMCVCSSAAPPEVRIVPAIGSEIQDGNTVHINENSVGTEFLCSATGSPPPVVRELV